MVLRFIIRRVVSMLFLGRRLCGLWMGRRRSRVLGIWCGMEGSGARLCDDGILC